MGRNKENLWWGALRRKLFRSSPSSHESNAIIVLHTNNGNFSQELITSSHEENVGSVFLSREDLAAISIQASFRGHLVYIHASHDIFMHDVLGKIQYLPRARRAYRALRSLVKLQALVRGVIVRRQARIALDCMHALARLQITVRARQLLLNN